MRIGKRLFPYPILNSERLYSQYKKSIFSLQFDEKISDDGQWYILENIHCKLDNQTLIDLINSGLAEIICIIECPTTMYRKKHVIHLKPIDIKISLFDIYNKVNISAFIVAKEDINNFHSEDFLDDYENIPFTIEKHDILAADDGYINNIDFYDKDDDKKSSIFIIIKDKNITDGTMQVDYDSEKLTISLPEEQWNIYNQMKRIKKYESLFFSILAIPALEYSLSCLQNTNTPVSTLLIEYSWFNSFASAYQKIHNKELTNDIFNKMDSNLESQIILGSPVANAVNEIFGFTIGGNNGNDEDVD